jgi:hypothetical protein
VLSVLLVPRSFESQLEDEEGHAKCFKRRIDNWGEKEGSLTRNHSFAIVDAPTIVRETVKVAMLRLVVGAPCWRLK